MKDCLEKLSFEDFKTHVKNIASSTPNKVINHTFWSTCAVGDYIKSVYPDNSIYDLDGIAYHFSSEILEGISPVLRNTLGNAAYYPLETYDKLDAYLQSNKWDSIKLK